MLDLISALALGSPGQGGAGFFASMVPILAMIAILWFLLIRPQQKEQQRHRQMVQNLKKGDEVVTVGGIYGRILSLTEEKVTLRISEDVKIELERGKVVRVIGRAGQEESS